MAAPALRVLESHALAYRRVWTGSIFSTFANPVLFLLAMGLGLGTLVDRGGAAASLPGQSYLQFLAPGLLAATAMQVAAFECTWPVMAGLKWRKTYHAALATPIRARDLVYGQLAWVTVRLVVTTVVFVAVMAAFGAARLPGGAAAVAPAVLTGVAFAAPITAFAAWLENEYGLSSLFRFGIVPMFLFSGTFFPVSQLPVWLQPVALVTPLWHGVELTRAVALGTSPALAPVGASPALAPVLHVGYLTLWTLAGTVAAVRAFERRLVR